MKSLPRQLHHVVFWGFIASVIALAVLLMSGYVRLYVVESGSMQPALSVGDLVVSRPVPAASVTTGDIVTVHSAQGKSVTHRVIKNAAAADRSQRALTLKGDANKVQDPSPYTTTDVDQKLLAIPRAGGAIVWVRSNVSLILAAVALFCLTASAWIVGSEQRGRKHAG